MEIPIDRPLIDGRNTRDAATQTVSAGFVATHNQRAVLLLTCDIADRASGAPHIQAGVTPGQELLILVTDDANRVTITSSIAGGGLTKLNGNWVVADGEGIGTKLWVVWDGTYWWEGDRKNGELQASGRNAVASGVSTIANGDNSYAGGSNTQATGFSAHAQNVGNVATGTGSYVEGRDNLASGYTAHASGYNSIAALYGEYAHAAGRFANNGDAQFSRVIARIATTDATLTETFLDGIDDLLTILDEYTYACTITVVGRQDNGTDNFMGTYHVLVRNNATVVALVGAVDIIYENNAGGWGAGGGLPVSILAGATNLEVWVEGLAAHNIRWIATVEMTRVGY